MNPRRLSSALFVVVLATGVLTNIAIPVAHASGPTVTGAGSTWVQIALDQWRADVAKQGLNINFQGVGSSAGRQFYIINQVDFAATEIPFQPDELPKLRSEHKSFQYLPDVAGGTSMMYNLKDAAGRQIRNLRLSAKTLGGIFTGAITRWSDRAIVKQNRGLQLPSTRIIPVIRSDGSGTSAQFSKYLASMDPADYIPFARRNHIPRPYDTSFWPQFGSSVAQKGSDGVANYVANSATGNGAIGYVEAGYALQRGFPVASIQNKSGNYTQPTSANVATALRHATFNRDKTQNLEHVYRAPEATAYPISSYSYMITPTSSRDISPAKGKVLGEFMIYFACAGQQKASLLGYSPLPPNLVKGVFDAVDNVPGAPKPPPLNQCANPTITSATNANNSGPSIPGIGPATNGSSGGPKTQGGSPGTATGPSTAGAGSSDPGVGGQGGKTLNSASGKSLVPGVTTSESPVLADLSATELAAMKKGRILALQTVASRSLPWMPSLAALGLLALFFATFIGAHFLRGRRRRM